MDVRQKVLSCFKKKNHYRKMPGPAKGKLLKEEIHSLLDHLTEDTVVGQERVGTHLARGTI